MKSLLLRKPLLSILILAALLRLSLLTAILITYPEGIYVYDSNGYWNIAYNAVHHSTFSMSDAPPLEPDYYRTPVYPLFIAFAEWIGPEGFSIILLQILLSVLSCSVVHSLARLITDNAFIANTAAFILAIDLPSVALSNLVLTETLFTFLLLMSFYFFMRYLKDQRLSTLCFAAILSGLLILCRPIAFFLPFLFGLFIIIRTFPLIRRAVPRVLLYAGLVLLTLSPWMIRNKVTFGRSFISVIGEHNLLNYHAADVYSKRFSYPLWEAQSILRWKTFSAFQGNANEQPYEYAQFIRKEALSVIAAEPGLFLKEQLRQIAYFFFKPTRAFFESQLGTGKAPLADLSEGNVTELVWKGTSGPILVLVFFQLIVLGGVYLGVLTGIIYMRRHQQRLALLLLLITIACFAVMNVPPVSDSRLRVPVMPLIAIISACGWHFLKNRASIPFSPEREKEAAQK